mmetsp:Transcript_31409/g.61213  ORF Transcript_31409/g.61213 Transcript_31409/m.61213 type:complete len:1474 (+) Transcript_31409:38-4459(+)
MNQLDTLIGSTFGVLKEGTHSVQAVLKSIPEELIDGLYNSDVDDGSLKQFAQFDLNVLKNFNEILEAWAELPGAEKGEKNLWIALAEQRVSYRALVLWMYSLIKLHDKISVTAAQLYMNLLRVPGNSNVYNPIVFRAAVNVARVWARANSSNPSKSKGKKVSQDSAEAMDEDDLFQDEDSGMEWLAEVEVLAPMLALLHSIAGVLQSVPLTGDAFSHVAEVLVGVTQSFAEKGDTDIPDAGYAGLRALLLDLHGDSTKSFSSILKHILSSVTMTYSALVTTAIPKENDRVRTASLAFIIAAAQGKQQYWEPVLYFMQHLCVRTPDKAEYRKSLIKSIEELMCAFPSLMSCFASFLLRFSRNGKAGYRATSVDLATRLLRHTELLQHCSVFTPPSKVPPTVGEGASEPPAVATSTALVTTQRNPEHTRMLLGILLSRCSDNAATVRAKALTSLATALELGADNHDIREKFMCLFSESDPALNTPSAMSISDSPAGTEQRNFVQTPASSLSSLQTPALGKTPAALQTPSTLQTPALGKTPGYVESPSDSPASPPSRHTNNVEKIKNILHQRSADTRPLVRKAAIQALEAVVMMTNDSAAPSMYDLQVFFDGCMDSAMGIRKGSMGSLSRLLQAFPSDITMNQIWLGAVLPLVKDPEQSVQDRALELIDELILQRVNKAISSADESAPIWMTLDAADDDMVRYLQQGVALMAKRKTFPNKILKTLSKAAAASTQKGLWILLEEITTHLSASCPVDPFMTAWNSLRNRSFKDPVVQDRVVRVLHCLGNICSRLSVTECSSLASFIFSKLADYNNLLPPPVVKAQIVALTKMCAAIPAAQKGVEASERFSVPAWERELLAASQKGLENFLFRKESVSDDKLVRCMFILGEIALTANTEIPTPVRTLVQSMISPTAGENVTINPNVRAHAFIALGKFCLKNEGLAKKLVTVMVGELAESDSPVIRNNVLVILSDLCRNFTAVVDNYVPSLTFCLRDANQMIRRHTLIIISQLLTEDYLKWKGSMFFRFLSTIVDSTYSVRKLAEQALTNILQTKVNSQTRAFSHFIESIFFFNGCTEHSIYNQFSDEKDSAFTLNEPKRRMAIYRFLLGFMSDEQKFHVTAKLCQDVLGGVVQGDMSLDDANTSQVIQDTLTILASKHIKLKSTKATFEDEDLAELENKEQADMKIQAARGKFLSKVVKKNTMENVVPILIELKRILEKQQSPLLRNLMFLLKELLSDYKTELEDVLAADRQLAAELQYDLRQFAQQQKARQKRDELRRLSITPQTGGLAAFTPNKRSVAQRTPGRSAFRGGATPGAHTPAAPNFGTPRLRSSKKLSMAMSISPTPGSSNKPAMLISKTPAKTTSSSRKSKHAAADSENNMNSQNKGADVFLFSPEKPMPSPRSWKVNAGPCDAKVLESPGKVISATVQELNDLTLSQKKRKWATGGKSGLVNLPSPPSEVSVPAATRSSARTKRKDCN